MKKIYLLLLSAIICATVNAQTIPGGDMETWRSGTSGGSGGFSVRSIHAPYGWYGIDSLIIYEGEYVASLPIVGFGNGNDYHAQVFKDTMNYHGGTASAKLVTVKQDTLGFFGGAIANYQTFAHVSASGYSFSFAGGLPITQRVRYVTAWVKYQYRNDSTPDTAVLSVSCLKRIGGVDSVMGTGYVLIDSTSAWQQVTCNITYTMLDTVPDTLQITLSSSVHAGVPGTASRDSSVLNVDDVAMVMIPMGTEIPLMTFEPVDIYPNPAHDVFNINCNSNELMNIELYSVNGQLALTKTISGKCQMDVSKLAKGTYFYGISDKAGNSVQKGKLEVQ